MGLMLQAPSDALMMTLAAGMPATNAGDAAAPSGFASLMQALLGKGTGSDSKAATDELGALPLPAKAPEDANTAAASELIAAALAALQAPGAPLAVAADGTRPQATAPVATAPAAAALAPAAADIDPEAPAAAPVDGEAQPVESAPPVAQALPDAPAIDTSAPALVALPPTETALPKATPLAESLAESLGGDATATVENAGGKPAVEHEHKPDGDPAAPAPPAGSPPQSQAVEISVVRSVGNAQHDNNGQHTGDKNDGPQGAQPLPRASAQGIAHAAFNSAVGELRDSSAPAPADPAAPAPAPAPQLPPAVEHVATTVLQQVEQGGGEAKIHLHPAELGEVVIRVHTDGDHVRVEIHADRAEAMNLLRDHTQDLSNLLGGRGLNLSDVYVGVGGQDQGNQRDGRQSSAQGNNKPENSEFAALMGIDSTPAAGNLNRLRAAYNPDGALSFRV